jgi:hypothetical protein
MRVRALHRLLPDPPRATFRVDGGEGVLDVHLLEVEASTAEGGEVDGLRVVLEIDPAAYVFCESRAWFGLRPGLARALGVSLVPDRPVRIEARMTEVWIASALLPPLGDPAALAALVAPLFEPSRPGAVRSPLAYAYEQVSQRLPGAEGTEVVVGFTPEEAAALAAPEIQPQTRSVSVKPGATRISATLMTAAHFSGPAAVAGVLREIRLERAGGGQSLELVVAFDERAYRTIRENALFGLTPASMSESLSAFDPARPIEATLALAPHLVRLYVAKEGVQPAVLLGEVVDSLADARAVAPWVSSSCWIYRSFMQQVEGQSFQVGFGNRAAS